MNERLALDRETVDEFYAQARLAAEQRLSPSPDRCQYCDTKRGDEDAGLHLLFDWEDVQPGDVSWDGEAWMPCRHCNWDFERGRPHRVPEGAIVMEGVGWSRAACLSAIISAASVAAT
jgi:hypothetical protein